MIPSPPRRQTRHSIERELEAKRHTRFGTRKEFEGRMREHLDAMRERLRAEPGNPDALRQLRALGALLDRLAEQQRLPRGRRRRDGSMPALVEPPRGPKPLLGGAAAPLEFDD